MDPFLPKPSQPTSPRALWLPHLIWGANTPCPSALVCTPVGPGPQPPFHVYVSSRLLDLCPDI